MLSYVPMHEEKRGEIGRGREEAYEPLAVLMSRKKMWPQQAFVLHIITNKKKKHTLHI